MSSGLQELTTGVAGMDFEHGLQVGLIEAFQAAVGSGHGAEEASRILERLLDFTNAHFLAEQLMMRLHNYPGYEGHVQEHDRLVETLQRLQRSVADGSLAASAQTAGRLRDWLVTHVQAQDQAFAAFLREPRSLGAEGGTGGPRSQAFPGVE